MRRRLAYSVIGVGLMLGGARASQPVDIETEGAYVNEASGFTFPEVAEEFERVSIRSYDADETNVGIGYQWSDGRTGVTMTVYVYAMPRNGNAPITLDQLFEAEENAVLSPGHDRYRHPKGHARATQRRLA